MVGIHSPAISPIRKIRWSVTSHFASRRVSDIIYGVAKLLGTFIELGMEDHMKPIDDALLIQHVIRHCQICYDVSTTREALREAKLKGMIDMHGNLTYTGRTIASMMMSEQLEYEELFGVKVTKQRDFFDQSASHQPQF